MENDLILRQFEEIEQKVDKVINLCKSLESENAQFINEIERLESELAEKNEIVNQHSEERASVRSKIDSLLVRLDDVIEKKDEID